MDTKNLKGRLNNKVQALQEPVEEAKVINMPEAPIVSVSSDYVALNNNALNIIRENLKNQPLSFQLFDIVKSPSGGSTVFSVPGLAGDEPEKELTGIILDYTTPRAYWDTPDPVEGTPPICYSENSIISNDGQPCTRCKYNDFGSKDGDSNAKACKESVLILLLRPENIIPLLVRVPVTSKMSFLKYTTRLASRLASISGVVTKITLEKATSKGGKPYAVFNFEAVNNLSADEAGNAKAYGRQLTDALSASYEVQPELEAS
jgi:hypothetical protein